MKSEREKLPRVVLVDDDELVLSTLRNLLEIEGGFQVLEFSDSLRAIEELGRLPVDIVISDYLMPGMNGVDVLKEARSLQPEAMRILLTGFADKQNAIRALNEAGIYQYLEKPWDNDQLLMVLENALREKGLRQQLAEKIRILDRLIMRHDELTDRQRALGARSQNGSSRPTEPAARLLSRDSWPADRPAFTVPAMPLVEITLISSGGTGRPGYLSPTSAVMEFRQHWPVC